MRLSVACNFDEELIDGLKGYPVYEVYGKLTQDFVGGGRPSFYLPRITNSMVERFVKLAHRQGIEFNYLLNSSCMGNAEYTRHGQREIRKILDWVCRIGCDSVTVSNIFLLQIIKSCYPKLKVRVSAHRFTDSPRKARFWQDHGADCIVLNETAFAREFAVLRAIRSAVKCELQLIVNNSCRQDCAIASSHATSLSHGSQRKPWRAQCFSLDYHMLFCLDYRLREPVNYIRANWIRPEDLHHYEAIGYDNFKIVERNTPTPELLRRVKAYANRRYDGNFFDLILPFNYPIESFTTARSRELYGLRHGLRYFFKPGQVNILKFLTFSRLARRMGLRPREGGSSLYINNRKLDGFIERFLNTSCINVDCEQCRYCHAFAERAVMIDPDYRREVLELYRELFKDMHDGSFWAPVGPRDLRYALRLFRELLSKPFRHRSASHSPSVTCPLNEE